MKRLPKAQGNTTITFTVNRVHFRALTKAAEELLTPLALEADAGYVLQLVALANMHLLRPHIASLKAYCKREGLNPWDALHQQIELSLTAPKKGKR